MEPFDQGFVLGFIAGIGACVVLGALYLAWAYDLYKHEGPWQ